MAWTFGGIAFDFLASNENGLPSRVTFNRVPRLVVRPLLDTGDADIVRVGYEPFIISGAILVSYANAASFAALNGTSGTLSDGTSSWTAVAEIALNDLNVVTEGSTGQATFTRPRA